jgi:hypothetical protein
LCVSLGSGLLPGKEQQPWRVLCQPRRPV